MLVNVSRRYLVGVVSVHQVECAGRGATERGGAAALALGSAGADGGFGSSVFGSRRRRQNRRRRRGQAAQPIGHRVCIQFNLCVIEILLSITALRVAVPPGGRGEKRGKAMTPSH